MTSPKTPKGFRMYYVICQFCQGKVEIPDTAVSHNRTDLYSVVDWDDCEMAFDYDEVIADNSTA